MFGSKEDLAKLKAPPGVDPDLFERPQNIMSRRAWSVSYTHLTLPTKA